MAGFIYSQSEDLWSEAVTSLTPELRELFSAERANKLQALELLLYEAHAQRDLCIRKQWRITKKSGDIIIIRDVIEKIIKCVDKFKALGDAAVGFAPGYASVPWAVIKMLLQTSIQDSTAFAAMIDGVEEVTSTIARCAIFEVVYLKDTTLSTGHLKASLVSLYAAVLSFLGVSCAYFSTKPGKRFMKATLEPAKEIEDALKRARSKQAEVERTAQIMSMEVLHKTSTRMQDLTTMVGGLSTQLEIATSRIADLDISNIDARTSQATADLDSIKKAIISIMGPTQRTIEMSQAKSDHLRVDQRLQVFDWLSSIRYKSHHLTEIKGRLSNSGEWLFRKPEYLTWIDSSISGTLWIHGMPGCGKTKLASAVIDIHFAKAVEETRPAAPLAYFYCSRNIAEADRSNPKDVLCCIARQLCQDDPNQLMNERLLHQWELLGKPKIGKDRLNIEATMDLILKTLADNPATIIIDALDELRADKRHELFDCLDRIVKQSPNIVKVLLTSRNDGDIVCRLSTTPNIYISAQENQTDISRFIDAELDKTISQKRLLKGLVSTDLRSRIARELNDGAQGMFRWVSLQIQNLCDPQRMKLEEDILHELCQLPQTLSDLYDIAFEQIRQLGPSSWKIALSTLHLLLVAIRPITWPEILHMLQVSHTSVQAGISREQLLDITCNFVDDDGQGKHPRLTHQSVREYLESRSDFLPGISNTTAAQMCLQHIAAEGNLHTRNFCYSTFYLGSHLIVTEPRQRKALVPLLRQLLLPPPPDTMHTSKREPSDLFKKWRRRIYSFIDANYLDYFDPHVVDDAADCLGSIVAVSPTAAICALGLDEILMLLKPTSSDIFGAIQIPYHKDVTSRLKKWLKGYIPESCFMLAVAQNQARIVWAVRKLGYSVDTLSPGGSTALCLASALGRDLLIRDILSCGANPNQTGHSRVDGDCISPDENQVRAKTSMGFHVNHGGHHEILSPFHVKGERMPVLHLAMDNRRGDTCVSALIEFGASVNTRSSYNVTPLQRCLEYGNLEIMFKVFKILLDAGADPDASLDGGRTIAHLVAAMGHHELMRRLLSSGADCSTRDAFQFTPLEHAIRFGHTETANLLQTRYGPPAPRKMPPMVESQQDPDNEFIPSIVIQQSQDSSQPDSTSEFDIDSNRPTESQFTSFENREWDRVVNATQKQKFSYRKSLQSLVGRKKSHREHSG